MVTFVIQKDFSCRVWVSTKLRAPQGLRESALSPLPILVDLISQPGAQVRDLSRFGEENGEEKCTEKTAERPSQ